MRRAKNGLCFLKTGQRLDVWGNVTTLQRRIMPTLRRSGQRRDVTEKDYANVATFQIVLLSNVATLGINIATFQRLLKIHITTLRSHVATFQRV